MPDDSPQPQPATARERSEEQMLAGAIRDLAAQPSHPMTQFILGRAADTIDRLLAEKARAEADVLRHVADELERHADNSRGDFMCGLDYACARIRGEADERAAALAATAPAATVTKEQENAR